jgi:uncharacterized protein
MSVDSDVPAAHAAAEPAPAPAVAGNPALLGLMTFLPSGFTLGLWFVGYLDTATLGGGMVPIVSLSAGLFLMIAAIWAGRLAQNTVAAVFGVFSAFWLSFGLLLIGLTSGWWGITEAAQVASVQSTYLLSFLLVFVILTLATLRLPLAFTAGFVLVCATFALAYLAVSTGSAGLFPFAGITTFLFCGVFAYILVDGVQQDLGGAALPMGAALVR